MPDKTTRKPRLGPYRTPSPPRKKRPSRAIWYILGAVALGVISLVVLLRGGSSRPSLLEIPPNLLQSISAYPPPEPELRQAIPLAPLLVSNQPRSLAVLSPREGATRLRRGQSLRVRFNRPMVEGFKVGRDVEEPLLQFDPPIRGSAEWSSRSTLVFRPAPGVFAGNITESRLSFTDAAISLNGEPLEDEYERVVVLDGAPRILRSRSEGRVNVGSPLRLLFDAPISANNIRDEIMAYEIGGGQRSLQVTLADRGETSNGVFQIDANLKRGLEPGARIGVALTPRFVPYNTSSPTVVMYELTPPPQIEGIACYAEAYSSTQCNYNQAPGRVIDIGSKLRLLSSVPLEEPAPGVVRVQPPIKGLRVALDSPESTKSRLIVLEGEWEPDQVYEVRVGQLKSKSGALLRATPPLAVRSAGYPPEVRAKRGHLAFELDARHVLRFDAINPAKGQVLRRVIPIGQELQAALRPTEFLEGTTDATPLAPLAPSARPNRWGAGEFLWNDNADSAMAVVAFRPSPENPVERLPSAFIQSTDLGVTLRGSERELLVWVTSLSDNRPVSGATVEVATAENPEAGSGRTNADGVAKIRLGESPLRTTHMVLVMAAGDRAMVMLDPRRAVAPYGLGLTPGVQASPENAPVATVFADRGAYRPGEKLRAKVTIRKIEKGQAKAVTSGTFRVGLYSPTQEAPLEENELTPTKWGTNHVEFDIPTSAALGSYSLEVRRKDDESPLGSSEVRVAEFRQPTFRVDLTAPEGAVHEGDDLSLMASAQYLFGAPVAQGQLHWDIVRSSAASYPERWREYRFTAHDAAQPSGTVASADVELDGEGQAEVAAKVALGATRRGRLSVEAEVTDAAGHAYTARQSFVVYPAAFEVGLRGGADWVELGQELDLDSIVIDHEGELVAGRTVEATFSREGWHSWWEWSAHASSRSPVDSQGYRLRRNQQHEQLHACELNSEDTAPIHCLYTPTRPGTYVLKVTTQDEEGRFSVASRRVYVAGPDEHPDRDPPGAPITVTPTQADWTVGERAELAFESPWPGAQALITVEREGVIMHERIEVEAGGRVLRIPLTAEMVPNVYVGVTLVKPRSGDPGREIDLDAPDLRFGVAQLNVRPATSRLEVSIEAPTEEVRSGTEVPLAVRVIDGNGNAVRGEVALWVVDEGTLRLTGFQVPNPTAGVFRTREAAFAWEDLRRALVSRVEPPPMPRAGGGGRNDGADAPPTIDEEPFDPTPLWLPALETDENGRVVATLKLPERETEYRVMAVALDEGIRWGRASAQVVASQPLVIRSALPRFVRAGDSFEATAFLHNTTESPIEARLVATIGDETREVRTLRLAPEQEMRIVERVETNETGPLLIRFEASGGDHSTSFEQQLPIVPAGRWVRSHVVSGIESGQEISIALPETVPPQWGGAVTLSVASHPFLGFDGAVSALEESYWCGTESRAAILLGLASYARLGVEGRPSAPSAEELKARGDRAVRELLALRNYEGGFGTWSARDYSGARQTSRAVHALQAAQQAGFDVDEAELDRARQLLRDLARETAFYDSYDSARGGAQDELAFALRVLADGDSGQRERMNALYEQQERLSPYGLSQLSLAMGGGARSDALLDRAMRQVLTDREDEDADPSRLRWYDHSARVYGSVLEAAVASPIGQRHTSGLAAKLLSLRDGGFRLPWGSSVETAHALAALSAYAQIFQLPRSSTIEAAIDGVSIEPDGQSRDAAWFDLPLDQIIGGSHGLQIEGSEDGPLFYAIDGRWTVPLGEADQVARGLVVALHRTFETPDGAPIEDGAEVPLGTMIRVRLFLFTEEQAPPRVALRDPIGSGFEAVDSALDTTARQSLLALFGMGPDDDAMDARGEIAQRSVRDVAHREFGTETATFYFNRLGTGLREFTYALRATTVGEFSIPPAQVEALYQPQFIGRSAVNRIKVVAPPSSEAAPAPKVEE